MAENNLDEIFLPYSNPNGIKVNLQLTYEEARDLILQLGNRELNFPACTFFLPEQQMIKTKLESIIQAENKTNINQNESENDKNKQYNITINLNPNFKFREFDDSGVVNSNIKAKTIATQKAEVERVIENSKTVIKKLEKLEKVSDKGKKSRKFQADKESVMQEIREMYYSMHKNMPIFIPLKELNLNNFVEVCPKTASLIKQINDVNFLNENQSIEDVKRLNAVPSLFKCSLKAIDDGISNSKIDPKTLTTLPKINDKDFRDVMEKAHLKLGAKIPHLGV